MEVCSFLCRIVRSYDDENVLMSSTNCVVCVGCWLRDVCNIYDEQDRAKCGALRDSMVDFDEWGAFLVNLEICVSVGKEAFYESEEDGWNVIMGIQGVEKAIVPDFLEGFFHIHEYGDTFVMSIFGLDGYLGKLE